MASVMNFSQLVEGATNQSGGDLDLVPTDVLEMMNVIVRAPVGSSNHACSPCNQSVSAAACS